VKGVIEIDFAGGDNISSSSQAGLQIRHAYIETSIDKYNFIAGQTNMIISQTDPFMLNGGYLGHCGNLFGRFPQLRFTRKFDAFKIEAGLLKQTTDLRSDIPQTHTGKFRYQLRLSAEPDIFIFKKTLLAIGADIGDYSRDIKKSNVVVAEMILFYKNFKISIEYFFGENTLDLLGSIRVLPANPPIKSRGGYANIFYAIKPELFCNTGIGYTKNKGAALTITDYTDNRQMYFNTAYKLTSALLLIGEVFNSESKIKAGLKWNSNRYQFSVLYLF